MNSAENLPAIFPAIFIAVGSALHDQLWLSLTVENQMIRSGELKAIGCREVLTLVEEWRPKLQGQLAALEIPTGESHAAMLLREAILKAQGAWHFPYPDDEVCHCRAVSLARVDGAILAGCDDILSIARETSAGTSCGTCRPDVEAILRYRRLGK